MFLPTKKFLSSLIVLGALQGCSAGTNENSKTSSEFWNADAYALISGKSLPQACKAIDDEPATYGEGYIKTLAALRKQSGITSCEDLLAAFKGKKLNFASAGFPIALDLLIKLQGVQALDLSNNGLRDLKGMQLYNGAQRVTDGAWDKEGGLRELRLQNNEISDASVVAYFPYLETLNLSNNKIADFETVKDQSLNLYKLKSIDLSNNPLTIPNSQSNTYNFLRKMPALNYLDISNTKIQSLDFVIGRGPIQYLMADNLKLTSSMTKSSSLISLQYVSMRNTTGVADSFFKNSRNLIYADYTGSDLASLNDFTDLDDITDPEYSYAKKDLTFLFVSGTKVSTFTSIPTAPMLAYFGAANTGFSQAFDGLAVLADYRGTSVANSGSAAQGVHTSCAGKDRCAQAAASRESTDLAYTRFFCKSDLDANGICQNPHQVCDGSTVTYKYIDGPNSLIKQICCEVPQGVTPSLPGVDTLDTVTEDGKIKICADLASDASFYR